MRKNGAPPALQEDTGRRGYREPDEPFDGREYRIVYTGHNRTVEATYQHAVEANPRKADEGSLEYLQRIVKFATGKLATMPKMPHVDVEEWLPYRDN